mmetsp:Transcript_52123/g.124153  ORF Transcript_52123/g.124153 Transcript_52123/m.124153 type:complete len:257 (-) Transcript_52123:171-941(-)|eukprot:CAMPEP_0178448998 /NCGR_PEP_ID=MMETSP0689_2-20121128/42299_1 /TAXON_ID=160604 /ORGANISM="Amphidinium massartii, Strain CS-259" /LENGTH=256 /DNA_ID=CAMNT_0020074253 /DNA_START=126 /DNA_END=896 /DNA_ORIENTATION=-
MSLVFLMNSFLRFGKTGAFMIMIRDAHLGRVEGVSWKMLLGLSVSSTLTIFNLSSNHGWIPFKEWLLNTVCAWAATVSVCKITNVKGLQDDIVGAYFEMITVFGKRLPDWLRHLVPYIMATVMTMVVSMFACKFSIFDFGKWVTTDPRGILCTFQNYLHGMALLPQLMVSRHDQYVAPAAARFLLLLGVLHIYEFIADSMVSWQHLFANRLELHEVSFLSGDFFAAAILMDFLYLVAVSKYRNAIMMTSAGLPLPV